MLILPLVVTLLAASSFVTAGPTALPAMLVGLLVGGVIGWRLERSRGTRRLPDARIWLRGEWSSFAQLAVVLVYRYVTSVASAINPALNGDTMWLLSTVLISATLSSMFLGRTAARLRVYVTSGPASAACR